jgi:hypothetical protein
LFVSITQQAAVKGQYLRDRPAPFAGQNAEAGGKVPFATANTVPDEQDDRRRDAGDAAGLGQNDPVNRGVGGIAARILGKGDDIAARRQLGQESVEQWPPITWPIVD